jgi:hypothetical protein
MAGPGFEFQTPEGLSPAADVRVVRVSRHVRKKRELFGVIRRQIGLPPHFGENWDALHDCLRDLSWLNGVREVVLLHDGVPFSPDGPLRAIYLELLDSLVNDPPPGRPRVRVVFPPETRLG